jgi:hypothetical protein
VCCSRGGAAISKAGTDTATEPIGEGKVILGINKKLIEESFGLVADITVVFLVEALRQNCVGKLALVAPVVCLMSDHLNSQLFVVKLTIVSQ